MLTQNGLKKRDFSLDALKCMAIFMVIMIHTSAPGFVSFGEQWHAALVYDSVSRISVPLFFMVTGALLLRRPHSLMSIWARVKLVLIPLVAWSLIYLIYNQYYHGQIVLGWVKSIVQGPVLHMWFIYSLIGAYLFLPLMSRFYCAASRKEKAWIMGLAFLGASVMPFFKDATGQILLGVDMAYVPIYSAYMLAGAWIYEEFAEQKEWRRSAVIGVLVWVVATIVTILGTYYKSLADNHYTIIYFNYYSPYVFLAAVGAFFFFLAIFRGDSASGVRRGVSFVGKQTLGVYMCHMIPLQLLTEVISRTGGLSPWVWYLLIVVLTLAASLLIVAALQKIPYVRAICP